MEFYKYQGAGNDFVIIDNRDKKFTLSQKEIELLCDRRFGIGADGLMLLEKEDSYDFKMVYYNADGNESTMCGNGGRCISLFAKDIGIIKSKAHFIAIDGPHESEILKDNLVALEMQDVQDIIFNDDEAILNTGSPHIIIANIGIDDLDVKREGYNIRHQDRFEPKGINVNFIEEKGDTLYIRTYERGVEDETLACGTGVTAAAISSVGKMLGNFVVPVKAKGGNLKVIFDKETPESAVNITLIGPAKFVFKGTF